MIKRSGINQRDGRTFAGLLVALLLGLLLVPRGQAEDRLNSSRYKGGESIRRIFGELVAEPRRATLKILDQEKPVALGVIVGAEGEILTKASELPDKIICELTDGRTFPATLLAKDGEHDLALIKISTSNLPVIEWDLGPRPEVGQWFVTAGQDELPLAVGIVSVANRTIPPDSGVLGISIADEEVGPRITKVFPNSGADKAGLQVGDVVTQVAGRAVKTGRSLSANIRQLRPGDSLKLFILRGEEELEVLATLGYPLADLLDRGDFQNRLGGKLSNRRAGFSSVIQHDTVLEPEECGGPVIGLSGKAVGLNIARGGRTETYAIPASKVLELYQNLKSQHLVQSQGSRDKGQEPEGGERRTESGEPDGERGASAP